MKRQCPRGQSRGGGRRQEDAGIEGSRWSGITEAVCILRVLLEFLVMLSASNSRSAACVTFVQISLSGTVLWD